MEQAEKDLADKNSQLEELYNELDGMQEALTKMETERAEQQVYINTLQANQAEQSRIKLELEL